MLGGVASRDLVYKTEAFIYYGAGRAWVGIWKDVWRWNLQHLGAREKRREVTCTLYRLQVDRSPGPKNPSSVCHNCDAYVLSMRFPSALSIHGFWTSLHQHLCTALVS